MRYETIEESPYKNLETILKSWNDDFYLRENDTRLNKFEIVKEFCELHEGIKIHVGLPEIVKITHEQAMDLIWDFNLLGVVDLHAYGRTWLTSKQIVQRMDNEQEIIKKKNLEISALNSILKIYSDALDKNQKKYK